MNLQRTAMPAWAFLTFALSAGLQAQTVTLKFNSLPSAQNWQYKVAGTGNPGPNDKDVFSLIKLKDGTPALRQDTVKGNWFGTIGTGTGGYNYYRLPLVDKESPFIITVRVRVNAYTQLNKPDETAPGGFSFGANIGTNEIHEVDLFKGSPNTAMSTISHWAAVLGTKPLPYDNYSDFHTFQLVVVPGVGSWLYRDCEFISKANVAKRSDLLPDSYLFFGDITGAANAEVFITMFTYSALGSQTTCVACQLPAKSTK